MKRIAWVIAALAVAAGLFFGVSALRAHSSDCAEQRQAAQPQYRIGSDMPAPDLTNPPGCN